jgi:hypothetical protein
MAIVSLLLAIVACGQRASKSDDANGAADSIADAAAVSSRGTGGSNAGSGGAGGASLNAGSGGAGSAASRDAGAPNRDAASVDSGANMHLDPGTDPGAVANLVSFHNGGFWNDVDGHRIEAHGAGLLQVGDTWYWVGEDKSANGAGFKAVNCYASKDLVSWQFRNAIITRDTAPELAAADRIIERPKLIYNDSTHQYVMWLHWEGQNYAEAAAGVFTSDSVDGDYSYRNSFRPNGNMSRDDALFKDDDGKAYFVSAANENADLGLYELTDDYLDIARQIATLFPGSYREAPALFKSNGLYYLITSAATSWDPNQAKYTTASSMHGPWSPLQNLGNATTYDTQSAFVIPVHGSQATTYIFAGDRWQDPDLASSKYIWLPLVLGDGTSLSLDYYAEWQLDLTTGAWSVDDGFIPQHDWKLISADSEETAGENGRAANAFDDSASTIWHTQYTGAAPAPPHEIQIDLGARYELQALRYLPRQDAIDHGMVSGYAFYVSDDMNDWGDVVASGTFDATHDSKLVSFTSSTGRYVRFVATSEVNGREWTSIAELDLSGTLR